MKQHLACGDGRIAAMGRSILFAAFLVLCIETVFSVPYRSFQLATHSGILSWTAGLLALAFLFAFGRTVFDFLVRHTHIPPAPVGPWRTLWLVIGLLLRVLWAIVFRAPLKSDVLYYFNHAKSLVEQHSYAGAFWPPGYPFFLSPFLWLLGAHWWVVTVSSLILFVITYWVACRFAERVGGESGMRIAAVLVAIWPGYLTLAGVGAKELLVAALLPAALFAYLRATDNQTANKSLLVFAGALIGWATLAQPGILLFPVVFCVIEIVRGKPDRHSLLRVVLVVASMLLVVFPWAARNYVVYHRVVLVATNGGSVFYRSNNPKANTNYIFEGEEKLPSDEFEADKEGYRLGILWIRNNPLAFLSLCVRKQVAYLGDDSLGFYETLNRGLGIHRGYFLSKMIGNLFWLGLWSVMLCKARTLKRMAAQRIEFTYCAMPLLYQWGIDSVFESGPRHHVPYIVLIAVLMGAVLSPEIAAGNKEDAVAQLHEQVRQG
jgi:4-amino-4-deoxy-L-arabinose transferase-like glycosyltransferase